MLLSVESDLQQLVVSQSSAAEPNLRPVKTKLKAVKTNAFEAKSPGSLDLPVLGMSGDQSA
jgi:hypothetical protein